MYFPSGAQLGDVNSLLGSFETCFAPVPSGWMIQIFSLPSRSERNAIHCPSGETSSESHVPSSVVNSIFRSDFSGSPFFSSFLSVFFSSFLSFSCSGTPCHLAPALRTAGLPKKTPATIVRTASHAVPRRLGCFALMLISSVLFSNVPAGIHGSAMPRAIGLLDDAHCSRSLDACSQEPSQ